MTATDASLRVSYDLLAPELQSRFLLLAVFNDTFDAHGAAAVWGSDSDSAQAFLSDLCLYSLAEYSVNGRYRLHDLVRLSGCSHATDQQCSTRLGSKRLIGRGARI
jgi:hypothetical protein